MMPMHIKVLILLVCLNQYLVFSQSYTSYFTGSSQDAQVSSAGGICLMGGATEDDNAMQWFLQRANGGDVLVLRATGSNGYNNYFFSGLGVSVNSVETIVCHSAAASNEQYILSRINQAEAIWFAGGNQWTYIDYWRDTPLNAAINAAILNRNIVIGGTSAGMAIQGEYYFSAQNGTITSAEALANPYHPKATVSGAAFLNNEMLRHTITDTHFDNPDRRGRLLSFMAKIYTDEGVATYGIACDEYTAVCIEPSGTARVFGGAPAYQDYAYFVQVNCELADPAPENCQAQSQLTWNHNSSALKIYRINGNAAGSNTFDINNWSGGQGGTWLNWSAQAGIFSEIAGTAPDCNNAAIEQPAFSDLSIFPNPCSEILNIELGSEIPKDKITIQLFEQDGKAISSALLNCTEQLYQINTSNLKPGLYFLDIHINGVTLKRIFSKM